MTDRLILSRHAAFRLLVSALISLGFVAAPAIAARSHHRRAVYTAPAPVTAAAADADAPEIKASDLATAAETKGGDDAFHSMFLGWSHENGSAQQTMAVPSSRPLNMATFTSGFGLRSDPFRGSAAMHAGVDLAASQGTAVYATADGLVDKAEWFGGYGNCVELDHGKGVVTRFGHLSRILVHQGQRVHRGDLIALVGSTGRSTGPHLHYEVRIDGHAVNPIPFLQSGDYVVAMRQRDATVAQGGPEDAD